MIGELEKTVLDCPHPRLLADFYCAVLGMQVNQDIGDWVVIGSTPDRRELAFQRSKDWRPTTWPDPQRPLQMHLDIRVEDADRAEAQLVALGATLHAAKVNDSYRVFLDPAGHPFCIVFGRPPRGPVRQERHRGLAWTQPGC